MGKKKSIDCPVCKTEMVIRENIKEVTRCPNCGHVYVDYPGNANEFHQHAYRVSTVHGRRGNTHEFDITCRFNPKFHQDRSRICDGRIKCLQNNLDLSKCFTMLDIGAGGGTFARWAREKLDLKEIKCQEISEICIHNLQMDEFPTYTGDFNSIDWDDPKNNTGFDLVTCWHVLEHIKDINKSRKLLGKEQLNWIRTKVDSSFKWSIFGQQILIGPKYLPTIFKTVDKENFPKFLHKYLSLAGTEIPYNTDQWDGYPKEREKFYKTISNSQSSLILAGDSHNSWLSNLFDKNNKFVGVEIGAPSITSPNFVDTFGDFTEALDKSFIDSNKDLIWTNGRNKGYVELNIFSEYVDVKFNFVSSVKSKNYKNLKTITFKV